MELQNVIDAEGEHDRINWRGRYRRNEVLARKLSGCSTSSDRTPADRALQAFGQRVRDLASEGLGVIRRTDASHGRLADDEQRQRGTCRLDNPGCGAAGLRQAWRARPHIQALKPEEWETGERDRLN